ncbi:MAG TPA: nicotinamide-nucleotide amidohydrolase family protein [Dehalococcoidia bacterium]|nr:nicotinamide-nucleotide amidohydrolase family protein [Dehalococcoidia bacterium]
MVESRVIKLLKQYQQATGQNLTLATIESASGGRISDRLTNIPGSSQFYKGSVISYSNVIKNRIVGVSLQTLAKKGAVSRQTAWEMAESGRRLFAVDICVSDTGIAGPTGATPGKPVGLFYIALSDANGYTTVKKFSFKGSRSANKRAAAIAALDLLEQYLIHRINSIAQTKLSGHQVVTCFIRYRGRVLILKRSQKVGTYQGKWSAVSGYIEHEVLQQAYTEIQEETGLSASDLHLVKRGAPVVMVDEGLKTKWTIYPFLFQARTVNSLRIDWENTEIKWIKPEDMVKFDTVPGLAKVLNEVSDN